MVDSKITEAATLLSAVADPIRLQLMERLSSGPSCVCDLQAEMSQIPGNLLSYHLKVLREAGLIFGTRRGRWIDYSVTDDALERLQAALPGSSLPAGSLVVLR